MQRVFLGTLASIGLAAALGCPANDTTTPPANSESQPAAEQQKDQEPGSGTNEQAPGDAATPTPGSTPENP